MVEIFYSLLLIGLGLMNLYSGYKFLTDKKFMKKYVKESVKIKIWRKWLGPKRMLKFVKYVFAPLGLLLGFLLVILGILMLFL